MAGADPSLFAADAWSLALDKFGAVTHLTVALYDREERVVCGPTPATPLAAAFAEHGVDPGLFADCARRCLAQGEKRPAVVVEPSFGLAVVGTSLVLDSEIVGAAVAGYALVEFAQSAGIERLARQTGLPFRQLWEIARRQQPMPRRRLELDGELLQVLGDSILRERHRTRQVEETAARLTVEMAAKDDFLSVLSHELRTPLTPILTWARILQETDGLPPRVQKAIDSIERNAMFEVKLVDDLLDLNRVVRDKVALVLAAQDLGVLLRTALEQVAGAAADKRIEVELAVAGEPVIVEADAGRLQQVLVNVLGNAVKYTPAGGHVEVTAERDGDGAVVRIVDDGEGIAPDFLPHAFDMFRQQEEGTRRRHQGLGIGLALVKRLVDLHHGEVAIRSDGIDRGTEVTIRLPLAAAPAVPVASSRRAVEPAESDPFGGLTVLLVEDTEDAREAIAVRLEMLGARVLMAGDGLEALEVLATDRPDLVLCDLRMPRMDGFELISEVDRTCGDGRPPFIAVSGLASDRDHRRTEVAGFEMHLDKPFADAALVAAVHATLAARRMA